MTSQTEARHTHYAFAERYATHTIGIVAQMYAFALHRDCMARGSIETGEYADKMLRNLPLMLAPRAA